VAPGRSLIIDMAALDFIDCSSLSALLRVQRLVRSTGGDVVLAVPQRQALLLLSLTGKDDAFGLHASAEDAVVSIGSRQTRYGGRGLAVNTARTGRAAPSRTRAG
jgi:anti-anti-sigma regulatory factor